LTKYEIGGQCIAINLPEILSKLEMTYEMFLDMCIMFGTDYNENVSGVGPVSAFNFISDYGSIEKVEEITGKSPEGYRRTREMFLENISPPKAEYWETEVDKDNAIGILDRLGVRYNFSDFENIFVPESVNLEQEQGDL
jgi:5'-3' exonuclease